MRLLLIAVIAGMLVTGFVLRAVALPLWAAASIGAAAALYVPRMLLLKQQRKAESAFMDVFPDAVDTVARMLRAGLPASLAIRTVGNEAAAPVNSVFAMIADQMRIGIPLGEALDASSQRIGPGGFPLLLGGGGTAAFDGGNLVSTLDVLSQIMRKRRAVRLKAKAVTSEIRLSAYVLGSLPIVTGAALLIIQPGYLTPLVNDPRGHLILGAAGAGLLLSVLAMRHDDAQRQQRDEVAHAHISCSKACRSSGSFAPLLCAARSSARAG